MILSVTPYGTPYGAGSIFCVAGILHSIRGRDDLDTK
jgi:hypothetical protein